MTLGHTKGVRKINCNNLCAAGWLSKMPTKSARAICCNKQVCQSCYCWVLSNETWTVWGSKPVNWWVCFLPCIIKLDRRVTYVIRVLPSWECRNNHSMIPNVGCSWNKTPIGPSGREGNGTPLQYSCLEGPMDGGAWWAPAHGVARSRAWLSDFTFTFHFHALEKEMATHSSVLASRIPGTGESGGLPSVRSHRVGHD